MTSLWHRLGILRLEREELQQSCWMALSVMPLQSHAWQQKAPVQWESLAKAAACSEFNHVFCSRKRGTFRSLHRFGRLFCNADTWASDCHTCMQSAGRKYEMLFKYDGTLTPILLLLQVWHPPERRTPTILICTPYESC